MATPNELPKEGPSPATALSGDKAVEQTATTRTTPPPPTVATAAADGAESPEARRSGRERKQTKRFGSPPPTAPARKETKATLKLMGVKRGRGEWSSDVLMQEPRSKLAKLDVGDILGQAAAWTALSDAQQAHLTSLLHSPCISSSPPALLASPSFQTDLRLFTEDLSAGRYAPAWLRSASSASTERARGTHDAFKERVREAFWGQHALPTAARAGLLELCAARYLRAGDVLRFCRASRKARVAKDALVVGADGWLAVAFASGTSRAVPAEGAPGRVRAEASSLKELSDTLLRADGRLGERDEGVWTEFRVVRGGRELGTLGDLRELYQARVDG